MLKKLSKRFCVLLLAFAMLLTLAPMAALAEEANDNQTEAIVEETIINDDTAANEADLSEQAQEAAEAADLMDVTEGTSAEETALPDEDAAAALSAGQAEEDTLPEEDVNLQAKKKDASETGLKEEQTVILAEDYPALELRKPVTVSAEEGSVYYTFTPAADGTYCFVSYDKKTGDPKVYLYEDASLEEATSSDDDSAGDWNFSLVCSMNAGTTYYLRFTSCNEEDAFRYKVLAFEDTDEPVAVTFHANDSDAYFLEWDDDKEVFEKLESVTDEDYEVYDIIHDLYRDEILTDNPSKKLAGWSTDKNATEPENAILVTGGAMDVYAVWADACTVTFHANNEKAYYHNWDEYGNVTEGSTHEQEYAVGAWLDEQENTTPITRDESLSFQGWSTDPSATEPDGEIAAASGLHLYAVWKVQYKVTFHVNNSKAYYDGGYWDDDDNWLEKHVSTDTSWYEEGSTVSSWSNNGIETTDEHLSFQGWSRNAKAKEPDDEIVITGDTTLYAVWGMQYKVTFNVNNAKAYYVNYEYDEDDNEIEKHESTGTRWYEAGDTVSIWTREPECDNTAIGFAGWSVNKNAKQPDETIVIKKDTVLYAVWKKYITVTVNANGGYFRELVTDPQTDDEEYKNVTTKTWKVLEGSTLEEIDSYAYNDNPRKRRSGQLAASANGTGLDEDTVLKNGSVYYVLWKDCVEVTYDAKDGGVCSSGAAYDGMTPPSTNTMYYVKGEEIPLTVQAKKEDAAFVGWSTNGAESGLVYKITPTKDMTLTAVYKEGYHVTFEVPDTKKGNISGYINGSYVGGSNNTILWAKGMKLSKLGIRGYGVFDDDTNTSYCFLGFSRTTNEKDIVADSFVPTGDMTLYAIFVPGYTISFLLNEGHFKYTDVFVNYMGGAAYLNRISVKQGAKIGAVETPIAPAGKIFVGWEDDATGEIVTKISGTVPTANKYYYAVYKKAVSAGTLTVPASVNFTNKAITPAVTVKYKNLTLTKDKDYTVAYKNNVKVGKATVTVTGKGKYAGSISKTFNIKKATPKVSVKAKTVKLAKVKKKAQTVSGAITVSATDGKVTYAVVKKGTSGQLSINKKNGKITVKKGTKKGTYKIKVKVTAKGTKNANKLTKTVTAKIKVK